MAILQLPTLSDGTPHYSFRVQLDGSDYDFTFRFGERRAAWVFDLVTASGTPILNGQMVTTFVDFLRRTPSPDKPPGVLWALNVATPPGGDPAARPGLHDLGPDARCRLFYTEAPE